MRMILRGWFGSAGDCGSDAGCDIDGVLRIGGFDSLLFFCTPFGDPPLGVLDFPRGFVMSLIGIDRIAGDRLLLL